MRRFLATLATLAAAAAAVSVNGATANVALNGTAFSNGTLFGNGRISSVHDGNKTSVIHGDTGLEPGFAYTLDLGRNHEITELRIYPRQDGCCPERLTNFRVSIHTAMQTGEIGPEVWGIDQFTDGTNPGSTAGVVVTISPPGPQIGQWIQIRSLAEPVPDYALQMSEVEVIANVGAEDVNRALGVPALSNRPLWGGSSITRLVDGDRSFPIHGDQTIEPGFAYEVNLGVTVDINRIEIIARQDGCCPERLSNYRVSIHTENNGQIGEAVWSATLHTDFSDPGSMPGSKDVITKDLDPAGQFKGVWVRLTSLDDPVPSYALQMTEVEVYGTPEGGTRLLITQQPGSVGAGLGRAATFTVGATAINGDAAQIGYQWQQDGVNIEGATNASYTTAPVTAADDGGKYRCLVSYPGQASLTSDEATLRINYAFGAAAFSNRPLYVPGNWNIAMLVNGNRRDAFHGDIDIQPGFAYEVNLGIPFKFDTIDIYPRQDGCCPERLTNLRVSVHTNNNDQIGQQVWRVDLYTDGTNPGSAAGTVVHLTADRDPAGVFEGQWIRILSKTRFRTTPCR
jgi:hypothetical protein